MDAETISAQPSVPVSFNRNTGGECFALAGPNWRDVLAKAVAEHPKGKAGVAVRLGVSRSYVSRVMSEGSSAYAAPDGFIRKVINRLYVVALCPHTGEPQPISECRAIANAPAPTHNPNRMALWKSCQRCPNKPTKE